MDTEKLNQRIRQIVGARSTAISIAQLNYTIAISAAQKEFRKEEDKAWTQYLTAIMQLEKEYQHQ